MKRIYHPYNLWEDEKNGMYHLDEGFTEKEEEELSLKAKSLLCDSEEFYKVALDVIDKWRYAAEQNLSNKGRNRQAWIGQASCNYKFKIPEYITKYGWRLMTIEQQNVANAIADEVIKKWEEKHGKKILKL